jgi:hypothetical protein
MKQTCLYLWYPLFQAEWDRCDQDNYLVKVDNLYNKETIETRDHFGKVEVITSKMLPSPP